MRVAPAGSTAGRGAVQRCSLESSVLAVAFLDGIIAERPAARHNGVTALD